MKLNFCRLLVASTTLLSTAGVVEGQSCTEWSNWGPPCPVCGHIGAWEQTRTRACGPGGSVPQQERRPQTCGIPSNCWSEWSAWSGCSAICGGGRQTRTRTCLFTTRPCTQPSSEARDCNLMECVGDVDMDPHFRNWQGNYWDFHGVCDMLFLASKKFGNGKGLRIHIRTKSRYDYSFIESAVIMIGMDILEVSSFGNYILNGVANANLQGVLLGDDDQFSVTHENPSKIKHSFHIKEGQQEHIVVSVFKDLVGVHLKHGNYATFGDSVGLMGNFTTGQKVGRDGTTVFMEEDLVAFGQEWQVLETEPMLFQTVREPQHPIPCIMPSTTTKSEARRRRRLGQGSVSKEQAEHACAHWGDDDTYKSLCVNDVLAMQDLEAAEVGPGGAF